MQKHEFPQLKQSRGVRKKIENPPSKFGRVAAWAMVLGMCGLVGMGSLQGIPALAMEAPSITANQSATTAQSVQITEAVMPTPPMAIPHEILTKTTETQNVNVDPLARKVSYTDEITQDATEAITLQGEVSFFYYPGGLYKIYCKEGNLTDIQLQPGEEIIFIGGGDTVRWVVDKAPSGSGSSKQWHVFLKPLKQGIDTNLIITTDRHSYQIKAHSTNWYNPIIAWTYPQEERAAFLRQEDNKRKVEEETISLSSVSPEDMNFNYKITSKGGNFSWAPKTVFDDGQKTYIKMSDRMPSGEAPALFVKDEKGGLMLVNYRVKNNYYIVDRLFQEAEMRNGVKEIVQIKQTKSKNNQ